MAATPRFHCPTLLTIGATIHLAEGAARHVQVLRLQPGDSITLFGGDAPPGTCGEPTAGRSGGEFDATISSIGRREVAVRIERHHLIEREPAREIHLAIGVPANERMDWLVEKASELGVASIQPLMTERGVVRLDTDRALKKIAHWNSIAISACEQCGGNRVPVMHPVCTLTAWARQLGNTFAPGGLRLVLSLRPGIQYLRQRTTGAIGTIDTMAPVTVLSGPEGGLSAAEEALAIQHGFEAVSLGSRVFRAETAAMVALTLLA